MVRSKLKVALDRHKGRDIRLEKQRKKEKEARKRKESRKQEREENSDEDMQDEEGGGVELDDIVQAKTNGKVKKGKTMEVAKAVEDEAAWETAESEEDYDDDDDDDMPEKAAVC